jgi:hypothetical protein
MGTTFLNAVSTPLEDDGTDTPNIPAEPETPGDDTAGLSNSDSKEAQQSCSLPTRKRGAFSQSFRHSATTANPVASAA